MSSRQINFFLADEDISEIQGFFKSKDVLCVDREHLKEKREIKLLSFDYPVQPPREKQHLTLTAFQHEIFFHETIAVNVVNEWPSSVIEFSPGAIYLEFPNQVRQGRLYAVMSYPLTETEALVKSDLFKKWVDRLYRQFKKEFLEPLANHKYIYVTPSFKKWMEEGKGKIAPGGHIVIFPLKD